MCNFTHSFFDWARQTCQGLYRSLKSPAERKTAELNTLMVLRLPACMQRPMVRSVMVHGLAVMSLLHVLHVCF